MPANKHIFVALLVTPVLAILAWFAVGALVGEKAQLAQPGQSYPLVEGSNCRYDSGQCDLRNEDLTLRITLDGGSSRPRLVLTSSAALDGVLLAVAGASGPAEEAAPTAMSRQDGAGLHWALALDELPGREQRVRVVAQAGGSNFFAEAGTTFLDPYRE